MRFPCGNQERVSWVTLLSQAAGYRSCRLRAPQQRVPLSDICGAAEAQCSEGTLMAGRLIPSLPLPW